MKKIIFFLCLLLTTGLQAQQEVYSRAKVKLSAEKTAFQLARLGFDITHGDYAPAKHFISAFSTTELNRIRAAGFEAEVLIPDLVAHYFEQSQNPTAQLRENEDCYADEPTPYEQWTTPENYTYGSMGGYHTYAEMLEVLDEMTEMYPDLLSARAPIEGIQTIEGNDIFWLRLSDNPNTEEDTEPEVLYTALHHAREPNGLSQMIFFLWYMLENYGTDPEVTNLVDNVEMYFIPCINVDGYLYNEFTNPAGGGFWRKNRRENSDGSFGVDLNRNYGYEWGLNDTGSSPNPDSQVYRGEGPFSEPETQAVKAFCEQHEFQIALNYHTFGNLLIHPWGYDDSATPDDALFKSMCAEMTKENNFVYGTGVETVGYNVNGDSDDWFYGEQTTKPKIFALTPEAGNQNTGFWPLQTQIDEFNKACMYMNLTTANLVLNYGRAQDLSGDLLTEANNELEFNLERLGLLDGDLTVTLTAGSSNVTVNADPQTFSLEQNETANGTFSYTLSDDIQIGDEIQLILGVNNGTFTREETLTKVYFSGEVALSDPIENSANWFSSTWLPTPEDFVSAPSSMTDSPNSNYNSNINNFITLFEAVELGDAQNAFLRFNAKWDIENNYDYAQVMISVNDGPFIPMCGEYTNTGVPDQANAEGLPLYDGVQSEWVLEQIDLSEYLTEEDNNIRIRFRIISDGFVSGDGFYFDDVEILMPEQETSNTIQLGADQFTYTSAPNPATDFTVLKFSKVIEDADLLVTDVTGKTIHTATVNGENYRLNTEKFSSGIYFYELTIDGERLPAERFEILK